MLVGSRVIKEGNSAHTQPGALDVPNTASLFKRPVTQCMAPTAFSIFMYLGFFRDTYLGIIGVGIGLLFCMGSGAWNQLFMIV